MRAARRGYPWVWGVGHDHGGAMVISPSRHATGWSGARPLTLPSPSVGRCLARRAVHGHVDHREDLIGERTRHINRLRWHLHEIDPTWDPKQRALTTMKHLAQTQQRLAETTTVVAKIAAELVERIRTLTVDINALEAELDQRTTTIAPTLRQVHGVAAVSAAKFIGEVAGVGRFRSRHAFARHNGTAPTPVWSGNSERHRLSRAGNRQLNAAIHRVALTQARSHPQARDYLDQRLQAGATRKEAIRSLKRRLSDVVYRAMLADAAQERSQTVAA